MDELDKKIINRLQDGLLICEHPYALVAKELGIKETHLIDRIQKLLNNKTLSRFGPMYDASQFGGYVTLAAMKVNPEDFNKTADIVNEFSEVAHNYKREHAFNMWFVISTETQQLAQQAIEKIQMQTGYRVFNMPKENEYYVGLKLAV